MLCFLWKSKMEIGAATGLNKSTGTGNRVRSLRRWLESRHLAGDFLMGRLPTLALYATRVKGGVGRQQQEKYRHEIFPLLVSQLLTRRDVGTEALSSGSFLPINVVSISSFFCHVCY